MSARVVRGKSIVYAATGWILLIAYFAYDYAGHGFSVFRHLLSPAQPYEGIFHAVVVLAPIFSTFCGYLEFKKNSLMEEFQEASRNWDRAFNATTDMIFVLDRDFRIVKANTAATTQLGGTIVGRPCFTCMHHRDAPIFNCPHKRCLETGRVTVEEVEEPPASGRCYEVTCSPIRDEKGAIIGSYHVARDISQRKKAEEERKSIEEHLRHAQKLEAIGTLAGGIAHDFNNILNIILGYPQLATLHADDAPLLYEYLEEVHKAGARAQDLVRQILAFSRMTELEKVNISLSDVLNEVLKMLRATLPTTIEFKQDLSVQGVVRADPTQMHQVIMNLCTNAYHAMRDTGGTLSVSLTETEIRPCDYGYVNAELGRYVCLGVSDTGVGMNAETKTKIFEPYFTTKGVGEGTGLGLAVVHGIVSDHRGCITVDSEPGHGSTFRVFLPLIEGESAEANHSPEYVVAALGGTEQILFVDDEAMTIVLVENILKEYGYRLTSYSRPDEALGVFLQRQGDFDLLITDMTMPHMTGLELAEQCRAVRPDLPVIVCTGYADLVRSEKPKTLESVDYVQKPFVVSELLASMRRVLEKAKPTA